MKSRNLATTTINRNRNDRIGSGHGCSLNFPGEVLISGFQQTNKQTSSIFEAHACSVRIQHTQHATPTPEDTQSPRPIPVPRCISRSGYLAHCSFMTKDSALIMHLLHPIQVRRHPISFSTKFLPAVVIIEHAH